MRLKRKHWLMISLKVSEIQYLTSYIRNWTKNWSISQHSQNSRACNPREKGNVWIWAPCSPLFLTWGHLPIVSEGQYRMNRKPQFHWAKEAEIWNLGFPERWKWRWGNCWKVNPKICMKFYLEKFGCQSCSGEGHVSKNRQTHTHTHTNTRKQQLKC